ncbi:MULTISPECIES: Scr1 family TA system antitoxin-like transcriptional regulator [unclassified Amycolatopsis]|uniref:Scr1 family TA system antitoxin-like transcriptional regulator n=1 Tax=unclassified Amycolatopsis TaxID=2618356 RepID=UPI002874FBFE|nr:MULTISPECIES: Scr1 family TA system antitoxin-like transcriptional regulator [unclassified Amycolatopsis]MDS0133197.1 helix-turn-helix transcriptional regulator [Amycolatopsis sp. 505]MDS0146427.1 helix-turn-helix transcriptional regulator [Amycolatopsis sp. CM201R]
MTEQQNSDGEPACAREWPSEEDLALYVLLSRVLHGLRRLPGTPFTTERKSKDQVMTWNRKPAVLAVGIGLRDARERRKIGLRELAGMLGISAQKLSSVELGTRKPDAKLASRILGCLRVTGAEFDQVMQIAEQVDTSNFVDQSASPLIDLLWTYEQLSSRIVEWAPFCIPDLLMPRPCPAATGRDIGVQSERRDQELLHRQCRRQTMEQGGRRYVFLIGDQALRLTCTESDGAEQQIKLLREAGRHKDVTVLVVPSGPSSAAAFTLFEDGPEPLAVALRHSHCTTYGTDKSVLGRYHDTAKALLGRAFTHPVTIEAWLDSLQARAS